MLERVPRKEMTPHVAARDAFDARHDHEIGIRADDVERIELNAAQPLEHRARAARAAAQWAGEAEVGDQKRALGG